jgi:hypothetical protein
MILVEFEWMSSSEIEAEFRESVPTAPCSHQRSIHQASPGSEPREVDQNKLGHLDLSGRAGDYEDESEDNQLEC